MSKDEETGGAALFVGFIAFCLIFGVGFSFFSSLGLSLIVFIIAFGFFR